jgi:hypothetical protein
MSNSCNRCSRLLLIVYSVGMSSAPVFENVGRVKEGNSPETADSEKAALHSEKAHIYVHEESINL